MIWSVYSVKRRTNLPYLQKIKKVIQTLSNFPDWDATSPWTSFLKPHRNRQQWRIENCMLDIVTIRVKEQMLRTILFPLQNRPVLLQQWEVIPSSNSSTTQTWSFNNMSRDGGHLFCKWETIKEFSRFHIIINQLFYPKRSCLVLGKESMPYIVPC